MSIIKNIQGSLQNFTRYRIEKYILSGFGVFIFLSIVIVGFVEVQRNLLPYKIILTAGKKTGESYILSSAIARVARQNSNIKIDVCETDGTGDNIKSLRGERLTTKSTCLSGVSTKYLKAHLGTAQADIYPGSDARVLTNLYQDHFHLLVNPQKVPLPQQIENFQIGTLRSKTVETPQGGGQRKSFENIANKHYKINFNFIDSNPEKADAVFRVRVLGNEQIRKLIATGWRLVPIGQVNAIQQTKYPAYSPSTIPEGVYRGSPAAPEVDLETIAVQRTLLSRRDVPDWVVEKIVTILSEYRQEIKKEIQAIAQERYGSPQIFDPETIYPLVNRFERPEDNSNVQIHKGALIYYDRNDPSFIQENADFLGLLLTIVLLVGSWLLRIKVWRDRRIECEANEKVDRYIENVVQLMKLNAKNQAIYSTVVEITRSLEDLFGRQEKLNQEFQRASHSLDIEEISQSGFRVFSEAYKSARETIEQAVEERQRKVVSSYVNQLKELLNRLDSGEKPDLLLIELDQIRNEAADTLLQERIFSRQSFRTFVDAYNFIRDAIERSCKGLK
ncbi:TAXI family TRAP transporter solute-binding subunit [Mastigocoleus testarum]|uniref:Uncharacterized protein n=1 Tax=Mastigocoleus testarum BC008 TaxID=371196 RepID=A0A0V7ZEG5_9CYAN|nr:TAXI family TRAP transporter solute-binding subunit [Mastigocoleus testarum]KST62937.1 hypothetical protein BC008_11500 [Mastigocoleus testarum BC008]KST63028.1 hypothetical protein BC008_11975 [Mastigocoleus testarum BC008]